MRAAAPAHDTGRASRPTTFARTLAGALAAAVAVALLLLPTAFDATAQESGKPAETPKPPPRPNAAEVLRRAIVKQGMPKGVDPAKDLPLAMRAKVGLQFRKEDGTDVSLDAERRYLAPNLIFTKTVDRFSRKEVYEGFDGKTPWLYSQDVGLQDLSGPGGVNDLKQLQLDVEMTDTLARAFLLRRLQKELKDARLLDDVTRVVDEKTRETMTAWVVEGTSEIDVAKQKKKTVLWLYVEQKEARLMGARVMVEGDPPLQLCFWKHATVDGVDIPRKIEIYRNDAPKPQITVSVDELDLAPKLTPADFKPPKS